LNQKNKKTNQTPQEMSNMSVSKTASTRRAYGPIVGVSRLFNPLVLLLAGTRFLPLYGVVEHRGRRSGKVFHTPVVVRPTGDGFIVPMPWGEGTDWFRNVRAAGECVIRWKGRDYRLEQPEVIDTAVTGSAFNDVQRAAMTRLGVTQALRLTSAASL
jgi:deazaflavin-dependent oxidoreductase (nitroreductase family)